MKKFLFFFTLIIWSISGFGQTPIITAIMDGTCTGGSPKMLEIYASGTVDFSLYSLENQTNGNTTWGNTTDLSPLGTVTDAFVYVYYDGSEDNFLTEFPSATTNMEASVINLNGDDRVRMILTATSAVIDQYGVTDVDGTSTSWEWLDSYAKRNNGTGPDGGFTEANWAIAGANTLDGQCGNLETSIGGVGTYTPPSSNDQTTTVTAPGTQLASGTISSIGTDSVPVLRFDITDAASGDGYPTYVTGVYVTAGPNNTIDYFQNLNGGGLYDLTNGVNIPFTGAPAVNTDNVFLPVSFTVPDGGTISVEAFVYINNTNAPDGGVLQFQINSVSHGFTADVSGSDFESTLSGGDIVGNDFTIEVIATQNTWTVQPTDVMVNNAISPAPEAAGTDALGNIDVDYSTPVSVNYAGAGNMTLTQPVTPVNGIATFNDIMFDTPYTGATITANDGTLTNDISDPFNISVTPGGADCANALAVSEGTFHAIHTQVGDGMSVFDQWYSFTAVSNGIVTVENCASDVDNYVVIDEGSCGNGIDLQDDACGSSGYSVNLSFPVVSGTTYYIGFGNYDQATTPEYDWTLSFIPTYSIINAYALSNDSLILQYESDLTSVDPADYQLTGLGQTTINFSEASIDGTDQSIIHLKASSAFDINTTVDVIEDNANNSTFNFYAGILPVSYTNTANDPDTVMQGLNVTLSGVVTANDAYNQVWIQDSNNPMSGVLIYSSSFDSQVAAGDNIVLVGQKSLYNGATEIINPILISSTPGSTPVPAEITPASDLDYYTLQDDPTTEQWEGQLVTVNGIVIDSLGANYEYFGHSCDGDVICFDDDVDFHYGSGFALTTGSMYSITGVVTYSYGHYKVNPRGTADATERVRDLTSVVEDPDTQVPDAVIDGTAAIDSLHAVEALKFKVTDAGGDGFPTKLLSFTLYTGSNNTIDLSGDAIDGGWFDFGDAANPIIFTSEPVFDTDHIIFYVDPETAVIDEGTSKEVILHVWFNSAISDESVLQIGVHADPHGFEATCMNSQFAPTFTSDITGGSLTVDTNIGVEEVNGSSIKVYPNPSNGIFNISVNNTYTLEITDITGRIISSEILKSDTSIELKNTGMYFLRFSNENGSFVQKVIVK